jgi:uncharacterized protein (TIGR00297 family)
MQTAGAAALSWLAGATGSGIVAAVAYRLRALTGSGACAATACGAILYGAGGWPWVVLMGAFFVTSSALTRIGGGSPPAGRRSLDHLGRRWDQVGANGGIATLAAAVHGLTGSPLAFVAAAGALATATADTWATEIGRWSRSRPHLVTTWADVPHGTSGGITAIGTIGAAAGASVIAGLAALLMPGSEALHTAAAGATLRVVAGVAAAGFSGALLDSVLGATIETRWRWAGNSAINLAATASGAAIALLTAGR